MHPPITLSKDQKIRVILRRSENIFSLLGWVSLRNRHFQALGKIEAICLQNNTAEIYTSQWIDWTYVLVLPKARHDSVIHRFPNRKKTKMAKITW